MRRRILLVVGALVALGLVAVVVGGAALAHAGQRHGARGEWRPGDFRALIQPFADVLGISAVDLIDLRLSGRSLAEIGAERGVDQATLEHLVVEVAGTRLDRAVGEGRLTRGQADALLQVVREFAPDVVTRTDVRRWGRHGERPHQPRPGGERRRGERGLEPRG
jgi:hypothetical protein